MRALITLLLIALFTSQLLAGNIDERKTDIYFANGIITRSQVLLGNAYISHNIK